MRLFVEKVFEGFVSGTDPVYTDAMYSRLLASADRLTISAFIDQINGTNPSIVIRSEHSNDCLNWGTTAFLAEIFGSLTPGGTSFGIGATDASANYAAYVRYSIQLSDNAGVTPQARMRLIVCGRGPYPVDVRVPLDPRP